MAEKNERLLGGDTTVTTSSDAAIIADINERVREIGGLPKRDIILDGETLGAKIVNVDSTIKSGELASDVAQIISPSVAIDPKTSVSGFKLVSRRALMLRKAV